MISCKRVPKPNGNYDSALYVSELTTKKRKKPQEPAIDLETASKRKPFHLRRKKPLPKRPTPEQTTSALLPSSAPSTPLVSLAPPAPPTPPLPDTLTTTNEITNEEITNKAMPSEITSKETASEEIKTETTNATNDITTTPTAISTETNGTSHKTNGINGTHEIKTNPPSRIRTNNVLLQDFYIDIKAIHLPPSNAPTTPILIDDDKPNDEAQPALPKKSHKKSHKKKEPAEPQNNTGNGISQVKKYHIKFQNGHLTNTGKPSHAKKPTMTKLQMKLKTKLSGKTLATKTKTKTKLKPITKTIKTALIPKTKPKTKTKTKGKVGRPPKRKVEETPADAQDPLELVDGVVNTAYYKTKTETNADSPKPKKRPKAKLGNCVHCKKGSEVEEAVIICDAACGTWFHASCAGYPKPLRESEYTMALCRKCMVENNLTCKDIHYFEDEYDIIQAWCKENEWTLQNIDDDGMCLFSSVFQWLDKETRISKSLWRVENLVKGVTRELHSMINNNELPIIIEFKPNLIKDIMGVLKSSHNLASLWNSHYEGLGIGDYFIAAIEKYLQVGICIYHVLDGTVCIRQKSDLYSTICNVVLRSEKYAAHYDLLLSNKKT